MHKAKTILASFCATLLVAGCNQNSTTLQQTENSENNSTLLADDTLIPVASRIITGADSTQNETHWHCTLINEAKTVENYIMSFWSDKTGVAGTQSMSWYSLNNDSVAINWDLNQITLNNFLFSYEQNSTAFSALSNKNDRLDCQLSGPELIQGGALQDFTSLVDQRIVNDRADQNDNWTCMATDNLGNQNERNYSFWVDGLGTSDDGNFTWYHNDDENIIVSYEDEVRELRSIRYSNESDTPNTFTAFDRQFTLDCNR